MSRARGGATLRARAAQAIDSVVAGGRSLDAALDTAAAGLGEDDRPLAAMLCYGVLRHYWQLDDWLQPLLQRPLKRRDAVIHALLLAGLYQLHFLRIPDHAVVAESVEASRVLRRPRHASLVNAILRRARRDRVIERPPSSEEAGHNHPAWLLETLQRDWPADWRQIAAANNRQAPMWLRVNPRHATADDYAQQLNAAGLGEATPLAGVPQALRLAAPAAVDALPGFGAGHVSVQDAAAQLAAPWALAGLDGRVLDACAAPGGKSGHLAELGGERIELTCVDSDASRLERVAGNLSRIGADATLIAADASNTRDWWDGRPFRAILLDAPCSATGVIRRHPDVKHLRRATDIPALAETQGRLLDSLWPLLETGGRLLYVTCSVLAAENAAVVEAFLKRIDDGRPGGPDEALLQDYNIRDLMRPRACGWQVLPGSEGLDGFFFASLAKVC